MKVTNRKLLALSITLLVFLGYSFFSLNHKKDIVKAQDAMTTANEISNTPDETAIFAGGCFWLMEEVFEKHDGVLGVE
ncbi:MAG: peptide methionine sulfoxide reductase [Paenibacillus sp.]|jgi:peptide methionine sulfoxide reductase msrA/msrB|nr:peptide methionine sulfoxide reductase [Paenibacillus sp.]